MRKGCVWLLAVLFWLAFWFICCAASAAATERQMTGIEHLAGVNPDLIWELPDEHRLVSMGEFKITAYCACEICCGKAPDDPFYGITATGTIAQEGRTIAVDPSVIPYGDMICIDGRDYIAEDTGGGMVKNRIDIYFEDHKDALEYGVQYKEVYRYGNEEAW